MTLEIPREIVLVIADLSASADVVFTSPDREDVSRGHRRHGGPRVSNLGVGTNVYPPSIGGYANQGEAPEGIGVGPVDTDFRISHRLFWRCFLANEGVAEASPVDEPSA